VFVATLNAHAPTNFRKDAGTLSIFIQDLKQPQPPRSLDGTSVLHVVELFSPCVNNFKFDAIIVVYESSSKLLKEM
jgi:hypothetical protein